MGCCRGKETGDDSTVYIYRGRSHDITRDAGLTGKLRVRRHGIVEEERQGLIMSEAQRADMDINGGLSTMMGYGSRASYNHKFCRIVSIHHFPSLIITLINENTWN